MAWDEIEASPAHITYLVLASFLILYALFSEFIRNRLHLSEPPLAVLVGILLGPHVLGALRPIDWGLDDVVILEATRVIVGIQVFAVGVELPKFYFSRHWKSVLVMLGPVMAFSWAITALFSYLIFGTSIPTSMIIGACLSPTDPVLAASVLANSKFSERVPARLKHVLSAESGCNDGVSFPFLYIGLVALTSSTAREAVKDWLLITLLWQCVFGITIGLVIGTTANRALRYSDDHKFIGRPSLLVFYLLLAILSVGVGSTLDSDDFLVAFGAGIGFARDGWFAKKTKSTHLPNVIDLILNSALFVYFGSIIPWPDFMPHDITPLISPSRLVGFLLLVLLFRRIPIVLACKRLIPDVRTYREALFCGHFGPMGLGALFLVMEARAQLETGKSIPLPKPPVFHPPFNEKEKAIAAIWPIICFVVLGSTMVHGTSVAAISIGSHFSKNEDERAPLLGAEDERLEDMVHDDGNGESASEADTDEFER
jgi:NhaP-type Na+/H+ or K+/H+ antiporter